MHIILFVIHQIKIRNLGCFNPGVEKQKFLDVTLFVRMKTIHMSNFNYKSNSLN